jgi:hypothetical protein
MVTIMVSGISATSSASTSALSNLKSGGGEAAIAAQIAAKQSELQDAKTDDDKAQINADIAALQAKLEALQQRDKQQKSDEANGKQPQDHGARHVRDANGQQAQQQQSLIGTKNFDDSDGFGNREMWV